MKITFIAIPDRKEVNIIRIAIEEEKRDPTVAAIDRYDKQYAYYPTLLRGVCVPAQVLINLQ